MLQTSLQLDQQTFGQVDRRIQAAQVAAQLYHRARFQGRLGRFRGVLQLRS